MFYILFVFENKNRLGLGNFFRIKNYEFYDIFYVLSLNSFFGF